jgi:hypothetical protein
MFETEFQYARPGCLHIQGPPATGVYLCWDYTDTLLAQSAVRFSWSDMKKGRGEEGEFKTP